MHFLQSRESLLVNRRTHSVHVFVEDWTPGWDVDDGVAYNTVIGSNTVVRGAGATSMTFQRSILLPENQEETLIERVLHHVTGEFQATAAVNVVDLRWNRTRLRVLP